MRDYINSKDRLKSINEKKLSSETKYSLGIAATWIFLIAIIAVNFYILGGM